MQEEDDLRYVGKWINKSQADIKNLPPFHSYYFSVTTGKTTLQTPCSPL
jgi:hypothetical protein